MLLRQKIELHTAFPPEEAAEVFRSELSANRSGFHGTEQNGEFKADYKGKGLNAFRPEIRLTVLPEEEGSVLWTDMRLPPVMLGFMILWTVLPAIFGIMRHVYLLLVLIPVFWVIAVIAFRRGVKSTKEALMAFFDAHEIV